MPPDLNFNDAAARARTRQSGDRFLGVDADGNPFNMSAGDFFPPADYVVLADLRAPTAADLDKVFRHGNTVRIAVGLPVAATAATATWAAADLPLAIGGHTIRGIVTTAPAPSGYSNNDALWVTSERHWINRGDLNIPGGGTVANWFNIGADEIFGEGVFRGQFTNAAGATASAAAVNNYAIFAGALQRATAFNAAQGATTAYEWRVLTTQDLITAGVSQAALDALEADSDDADTMLQAALIQNALAIAALQQRAIAIESAAAAEVTARAAADTALQTEIDAAEVVNNAQDGRLTALENSAAVGPTVTAVAVANGVLTLTRSDGSTLTVTLPATQAGTPNEIESGALSGTNLVLTKADSDTVTIPLASIIANFLTQTQISALITTAVADLQTTAQVQAAITAAIAAAGHITEARAATLITAAEADDITEAQVNALITAAAVNFVQEANIREAGAFVGNVAPHTTPAVTLSDDLLALRAAGKDLEVLLHVDAKYQAGSVNPTADYTATLDFDAGDDALALTMDALTLADKTFAGEVGVPATATSFTVVFEYVDGSGTGIVDLERIDVSVREAGSDQTLTAGSGITISETGVIASVPQPAAPAPEWRVGDYSAGDLVRRTLPSGATSFWLTPLDRTASNGNPPEHFNSPWIRLVGAVDSTTGLRERDPNNDNTVAIDEQGHVWAAAVALVSPGGGGYAASYTNLDTLNEAFYGPFDDDAGALAEIGADDVLAGDAYYNKTSRTMREWTVSLDDSDAEIEGSGRFQDVATQAVLPDGNDLWMGHFATAQESLTYPYILNGRSFCYIAQNDTVWEISNYARPADAVIVRGWRPVGGVGAGLDLPADAAAGDLLTVGANGEVDTINGSLALQSVTYSRGAHTLDFDAATYAINEGGFVYAVEVFTATNGAVDGVAANNATGRITIANAGVYAVGGRSVTNSTRQILRTTAVRLTRGGQSSVIHNDPFISTVIGGTVGVPIHITLTPRLFMFQAGDQLELLFGIDDDAPLGVGVGDNFLSASITIDRSVRAPPNGEAWSRPQ